MGPDLKTNAGIQCDAATDTGRCPHGCGLFPPKPDRADGKGGLEAGHGLWIVPCQSVHTFWMRFSIDVVFLDEHRKVIHLVENLRPFRISKHLSRARSVIELPVSSIRATGTQMGDEIRIGQEIADS